MDEGYREETVIVPTDLEPVRLDKYLAALPRLDLSRAFIQNMAAKGLITVAG